MIYFFGFLLSAGLIERGHVWPAVVIAIGILALAAVEAIRAEPE